MVKSLLVCVLALTVPVQAQTNERQKSEMVKSEKARGYSYIGVSPTSYAFVKSSTIRHLANGTIKAWVKFKAKPHADEKADHTLFFMGFNCSRELFTIYERIKYDEDGGVIETNRFSETWVPVTPD